MNDVYRDGSPHPDNVGNDKYKVIVQGITGILRIHAPGMTQCYLWLDFSCLHQNTNLTYGGLHTMEIIMKSMDCIFTPITDEWSCSTRMIEKWDQEIDAPCWIHETNGYIHRAWCRLEMFYAANVPMLINSPSRGSKFKYGLHLHHIFNRRPHFVFGISELKTLRVPLLLPPFQNSNFTRYDPRQGQLTCSSDSVQINELVDHLLSFMIFTKPGWSGDIDENRKPTGQGTLMYESGSVYTGSMLGGLCHGEGIMQYAVGSVYEGEYNAGARTGKGRFRNPNGMEYNGYYMNNKKHGMGRYVYETGSTYDGHWDMDRMHGKGKINYADGSSYEGGRLIKPA
jgi:hypothetical protein